MNREQTPKGPAAKTGFFATLRGLLRADGTGAPSHPRGTRALATPPRRAFAGWGGLVSGNSRAPSVPRALGVTALALLALALTTASASAAGDANQSVCPASTEESPGFRFYLPDCRAYEQVSPVFKDGFPVGSPSLLAGGTHVKAASLGLFAGATPGCSFQYYAFSRTATAWTTTPLADAPLSEFVFAGATCVPVLLNGEGASLLQMHLASQSVYGRDLYLRRPNGSLTLVGPMLPPSAVPPTPTGTGEQAAYTKLSFVGATPDFSHMLFTLAPLSSLTGRLGPGVETQLWPGDTTTLVNNENEATASLYEYTGTGKTVPALVGLDNGGHLISDCGTFPGGARNGNHRNVISADGSRVFFTALGAASSPSCVESGTSMPPVEEIFARIDGSHTVAISQPQGLSPAPPNEGCTTPECEENTTEEANFRDANFEGASADGSKVFFTSTQQLLDSATQDSNPEDGAVPGGAGEGCQATAGPNGCNLYEYDFGKPEGRRLGLLSGGDSSGLGPEVQGVAGFSEDGSHVYFVANGVLTEEPNAEGEFAESGSENLYVSDTATGQTAFIVTLASSDSGQWSYSGEAQDAGARIPGSTGQMNVTDDGNFLVFTSSAHLTPDDTGAVQQVFRYDAATGALLRISIGDEGFHNDGNSTVGGTVLERAGSFLEEATDVDQHPAVSEDGSAVVFASSLALTPQALDNRCRVEEEGECLQFASNVYEYRDGHVYLISDGGDATKGVPSRNVISPSARDIFFITNDPLVPPDGDTLGDVYDARVDGGFPVPATPVSCQGEACQGQAGTPPANQSPASSSFSGPGNQKQKRHKRKHHGKKHHKRHSKRSAHTNRRASR